MKGKYELGECHLVRLKFGADLLQELCAHIDELGIEVGRITVIGSVKRGTVGFYNQIGRKYSNLSLDKPLEILSCTGNISHKDGTRFPHIHIVYGDENGNTWGGHLLVGNPIFAAEAEIQSFIGDPLERVPDRETGLSLWSK